jgi:hypothetical protein
VVEASAVYTASDTEEAKQRLSALQTALGEVEAARGPFLSAMEGYLLPEMRRRLDLAVKEFVADQTETAALGLVVSPRAALIQASDEATVKNRERMVAEISVLGRDVLARLEASGTRRRKRSARPSRSSPRRPQPSSWHCSPPSGSSERRSKARCTG